MDHDGEPEGLETDVLFGQVWTRPGLSPKERSLSAMAVAKQVVTSDT